MRTIEEKQVQSKWFGDEMFWYALFTRSTAERQVVDRIQKKVNPNEFFIFCPLKDYAFRRPGIIEARHVPWLSGYVFIISTVAPAECLSAIYPIIINDRNVFKFVRHSSDNDAIALSEHDKRIMRTLLDTDFHIPALNAVKKGDWIQIDDFSMFNGINAKVSHIQKRKQTATVEIEMLGTTVKYEVMLRYITELS
jgi:transcription antitermination factor NusG